MEERKILLCWITPSHFLDTDVYIMRYIPDYFSVNWVITKRKGDSLDHLSLIEKIQENKNININICEWEGKASSLKGLRFSYQIQKQTLKADIVYQPSSFPYTLPLMILFGKRNRYVVPIHNVHTPKGGSRYWINKLYTSLTIRYFCNFITFSKPQCNLLKAINDGANILCTSFMLKDFGKSLKRKDSNLITFLSWGNIRRYKRIDVLIDAAQKVYERTSIRFKVIIAGSCNDWSTYQARIKYPELFDMRIGRVKDCDIPDLFAESDYFVTPYQDIAQSGSLIVALNYNKPIISSKLEAFEDYIVDGENGFFIKPADVDDLERVIEYVLNNHHNIYERMRENQKKMISVKFDDKVVVDGYVNYLKNVIG